jgi:galactose-3-O-sulfotransferase
VYSHDPADLEEMRRRVHDADVVYGHFSYGFHELLGADGRYVTLLRNPVDRVVSFFQHQSREPASEYGARIAAGMSLTDLLESGQCHEVNNHMVRILSGHLSVEPTHDRALLERAEANIDAHFDVVGITERLDDSLQLIGRTLGWKPRRAVPMLNADPGRGSLSLDEHTRDAIVEFNRLDVEVYERVVADFETRRAPRWSRWERIRRRTAIWKLDRSVK